MEGAGRKHTDAEIAERRRAIRAVMAAGRWSMAAAEQIAAKFDVSRQQVADVDRRIVLQEIRDAMTPEERENNAAQWMLQVDEVYATAMAAGDRGNAVKALALKGKVLGLDAPIKVEHSGPGGGKIPISITDADLDEMLQIAAQLAAQHAAKESADE